MARFNWPCRHCGWFGLLFEKQMVCMVPFRGISSRMPDLFLYDDTLNPNRSLDCSFAMEWWEWGFLTDSIRVSPTFLPFSIAVVRYVFKRMTNKWPDHQIKSAQDLMSDWSKKQLFCSSNSIITLSEWSSLPNEHPRELPIVNHKTKRVISVSDSERWYDSFIVFARRTV